jgi:hypothetical protein
VVAWERVQACPGEALDQSLVDVGQARVSEVVTQVMQVGPGAVRAHDAASLAAAMVRHVLPVAGSLRLEVTTDEYGTWLHLTYVPKECSHEGLPTAPGDLTLVNSTALRWGCFGDGHWHTLWALLASPPHAIQTGDDAADALPDAAIESGG